MNREEMIRRMDAGEDPLEVSIVKWEEIRDGSTDTVTHKTCALCWNCNLHCDRCVVYKKNASYSMSRNTVSWLCQ